MHVSSKHHDDAYDHLAKREGEVIRLVAEGKTNNEIAGELYLATATVKWYVRCLLMKTGESNRAGLAATWTKHALGPTNPPFGGARMGDSRGP